MQYAGISFTLKPGQKREVEINCAKHVLNAFGQRGLTYLKYGDKEDDIAKEAKKRNFDFKKKQIVDHNTRNEQRKQMGLGYLDAGKKIREYSEQLGVSLVEPFQTLDRKDDGEIAKLRLENMELKTRVDRMMTMMENFMAQKDETKAPEEPPPKKKPFGRE